MLFWFSSKKRDQEEGYTPRDKSTIFPEHAAFDENGEWKYKEIISKSYHRAAKSVRSFRTKPRHSRSKAKKRDTDQPSQKVSSRSTDKRVIRPRSERSVGRGRGKTSKLHKSDTRSVLQFSPRESTYVSRGGTQSKYADYKVSNMELVSVPECLFNSRGNTAVTETEAQIDARRGIYKARKWIEKESQAMMKQHRTTPPTPQSKQASKMVLIARNQMSSLGNASRTSAMLTETVQRAVRMTATPNANDWEKPLTNFSSEAAPSQADRRLAGSYETQRLESDIQKDRNYYLQAYLSDNNLSSSLYCSSMTTQGQAPRVIAMPTRCSSPMRCYTKFHTTKSSRDIHIYREAQSIILAQSFIYKLLPYIYGAIDRELAARKKNIHKRMMLKKRQNGSVSFHVKDWLEIDRPLIDYLERLNEKYKQASVPLRVVFRKTRENMNQYDYDFWFVFPNTLDEIRGGYKRWEGIEHVTTLNEYYNASNGGLQNLEH